MQAQNRTEEAAPRLAAAWRLADPDAREPRVPLPPALEALEPVGTPRSFARGAEIHAAGDPTEFCFRILRGTVRTVGLDEDGRRQVVEFLVPGDLLGFDSLGTHHLSAEALTDTLVVRYPRRAVDALAERHPALALRLRDLALQKLRRAHEAMFLLGRRSAGERIAAFLIEMAARAPGDGRGAVELPMTRGDIADHLGLTTETVSRTMAQLRRAGTIAGTRSGIEIRDRDALLGVGAGTRH